MKEESAKLELEALRLAAIQNEPYLQTLVDAGMEHIEFGPELREASQGVALEYVIPNWFATWVARRRPSLRSSTEFTSP